MSFASPSGEEEKTLLKFFFLFGLREMDDDESRAAMRKEPRTS